MQIRRATLADANAANEIYESARAFMRSTGNLTQWSGVHPSKEEIIDGISDGTSYVCVEGEEIVATFYFNVGDDPTYRVIYDGEWRDSEPYAVIHRIAVKYPGRRIADACFDFCKGLYPSIKIDTHRDNIPMQRCLLRNGFAYCGIIHLADGEPRLAYQWLKEE
ncbi:MAG: N-acetyltransferase [Clostridia bacterium]|nr:N-acetyltransferase [Clostridia bacterium]